MRPFTVNAWSRKAASASTSSSLPSARSFSRSRRIASRSVSFDAPFRHARLPRSTTSSPMSSSKSDLAPAGGDAAPVAGGLNTQFPTPFASFSSSTSRSVTASRVISTFRRSSGNSATAASTCFALNISGREPQVAFANDTSSARTPSRGKRLTSSLPRIMSSRPVAVFTSAIASRA